MMKFDGDGWSGQETRGLEKAFRWRALAVIRQREGALARSVEVGEGR